MRGKLARANDDGWMDAYRSGHITAVYAYAQQVTGPHSHHALSIIHRALAAWSGHWVVVRGSAEEDGAAQRNTEINDLGSTARVHLAAVVRAAILVSGLGKAAAELCLLLLRPTYGA